MLNKKNVLKFVVFSMIIQLTANSFADDSEKNSRDGKKSVSGRMNCPRPGQPTHNPRNKDCHPGE